MSELITVSVEDAGPDADVVVTIGTGGGGGGSGAWEDITGKPSTFPPSAHNHAIADTTGLQAALDSKAVGKPATVVVGRGANADFVCTGTLGSPTDHTTLQAAINAVQTAGGGTVFIKAGVYFLGATVNVTAANVQIIGEGRGTELRCVGDYGNVFLCALGTTPTAFPGLAGLRFEHLRFETTVDRTTGAAIRANYTHNAVLSHLYIADGTYGHSFGLTTPVPKLFYDGIYLDGQDQCTVEDVVAMCLRYCVHVNGSTYASADFSYDGTVRNSKFWGKPGTPVTGSVAIHAINSGGFVVEFCSTNNHEHAIVIDYSSFPASASIFTIRGGYAENNAGHDYVYTGDGSLVIHDLWGTVEFNGTGFLSVPSIGRSYGIEINGEGFAIICGVATVTNTGGASVLQIGPENVKFPDGSSQATAFTNALAAKLAGLTPTYLQQTTPAGSGWIWFRTNGSGDVIDILTG